MVKTSYSSNLFIAVTAAVIVTFAWSGAVFASTAERTEHRIGRDGTITMRGCDGPVEWVTADGDVIVTPTPTLNGYDYGLEPGDVLVDCTCLPEDTTTTTEASSTTTSSPTTTTSTTEPPESSTTSSTHVTTTTTVMRSTTTSSSTTTSTTVDQPSTTVDEPATTTTTKPPILPETGPNEQLGRAAVGGGIAFVVGSALIGWAAWKTRKENHAHSI